MAGREAAVISAADLRACTSRDAALGALKTQGLQLDDLRVPETPQIFFKHEERPLFVVPGKLRVNEPRRDELNRGR